MDPSSVALVAFSSILVVGSSIAIIVVNYRRICKCFLKEQTEHVTTVVTEASTVIQVWS